MQSKLLKLNKDIQELEVQKAGMLMEVERISKELKESAESLTVANEKIKLLELDYFKKEDNLLKNISKKQDILDALNDNIGIFEDKKCIIEDKINDLNKQKTDLEEQIVVLKENKESFNSEKNEVLAELICVKKESFELTRMKAQEVANLDKEIENKKTELDSLLFNIQKEKAQIAQDQELLDSRERDLKIYEGRLKEKYPNEKIIL